jgi:hypothetical protein
MTEEADVKKAAKAALRRLAEQRATWLLVYDNVTAPDHSGPSAIRWGARTYAVDMASPLRAYLPDGEPCCIVH